MGVRILPRVKQDSVGTSAALICRARPKTIPLRSRSIRREGGGQARGNVVACMHPHHVYIQKAVTRPRLETWYVQKAVGTMHAWQQTPTEGQDEAEAETEVDEGRPRLG